MANAISAWFERHFSDPQVIGLAAVLIGGFAIIYLAGEMLTPVIASMVIAYLLEGLVGLLERKRVPRFAAVLVVFIAFMTALVFVMFGLLPLLSRQATQLLQQLPSMIGSGQELLLTLPHKYPELFSEQQVLDLLDQIRAEAVNIGQNAVQASLSSVLGILTLLVYLILMPLMVFFFLKDKTTIVLWVKHFLPSDRRLAGQVWADVDMQIGNYVRGKFIEIVIVWIVTYSDVRADGSPVLDAPRRAGRIVGRHSLRRCGHRHVSGGRDCLLPVGIHERLRVHHDRLRDHPGTRRQRAGTAAVLRGRQPSPDRDHHGGTGVRWDLGVLGRLLRNSARDPRAGGAESVATAKICQEPAPE